MTTYQNGPQNLNTAIRIGYVLQIASYLVLPLLGPLLSIIYMYSIKREAQHNPMYASHVNNIIRTTWLVFWGYLIAALLSATIILAIIGWPLAILVYVLSLLKFVLGFIAFEKGEFAS